MSPPPKWFVKLRDGSIQGPFEEARIHEGIATQKIPCDARIQQDRSRWFTIEEVERAFAILALKGWFMMQVDGSIEGPITGKRLKQLQNMRSVTTETLVRKGTRGNWTPLGLVGKSPSPQSTSKTSIRSDRRSSIPLAR